MLSTTRFKKNGSGWSFLPGASLHAICPFGGVKTAYELPANGALLQKTRDSSVILLMAVLFGTVFCGWICLLGSIQEWYGKIGRKWLGPKRDNPVNEYVGGAPVVQVSCLTLCPMNICVSRKTVIRNHQCIACLECTAEVISNLAETIHGPLRGAHGHDVAPWDG